MKRLKLVWESVPVEVLGKKRSEWNNSLPKEYGRNESRKAGKKFILCKKKR